MADLAGAVGVLTNSVLSVVGTVTVVSFALTTVSGAPLASSLTTVSADPFDLICSVVVVVV